MMKIKALQVFLYLALWAGSMLGIPIRPDQVRDLLRTLNQPKISDTLEN
jgi:hypothetical protein